MSFQWTITPEAAFVPLTNAYIAAIRRGVRQIADRRAPQIEQWMKDNHLWQNITGAAEAGLHTTVEGVSLDMVQIILEHGVDYGQYLELSRGGVWGILAPAVDYWGVIVWNDVQALLR